MRDAWLCRNLWCSERENSIGFKKQFGKVVVASESRKADNAPALEISDFDCSFRPFYTKLLHRTPIDCLYRYLR